MRLMVAQMKNQDPTKPMDNFEFLSQIAQFGTVDGIQNIQKGFGDLTSVLNGSQAMEAAGLVGRPVMTDSNIGVLEEAKTLDATIRLPNSSSGVVVYFQDMNGRLVHSQVMGASPAGDLPVQWDGIQENGEPALPGQYRVSAEAVIGGQTQAVSAYSHTLVQSVTIDRASSGVLLNLAGGKQVGLSQVKSFL